MLAHVDPALGPIVCHGAVEAINALYREAGVALPPTRLATDPDRPGNKNAISPAPSFSRRPPPPQAHGSSASAIIPTRWRAAGCRCRGNRRRRGLDRGFALSDHADWPGLIAAIKATGAERILVTHGYTEPLTRYLREKGFDARALPTAYGDDEDAGGAEAPAEGEGGRGGGRSVKAFAALYRKLDSGDLDPRQAGGDGRVLRRGQGRADAMGERRLDRLFPERRQAAPDRADPPSLAPGRRRLGLSGLALRRELWRGRRSRRDAVAVLPESAGGADVSLDVWMRERLLPLPSLPEEERYARLKQWVGELATDERLAFFKLITGELRVGVSRLQVVKALAEVAGVDEGPHGPTADRLFAGAARPDGRGFRGADWRSPAMRKRKRSTRANPIRSISRNRGAGRSPTWRRRSGRPSDWIIEWKYDGIRAQLLKRGENWRLWSRGEELISDAYPDLEPLARALPSGTAIDGELVVLIPPEHDYAPDSLDGLAIFASLQQRLGRKIVSEKTLRELPVAFIAYDLIEAQGRDLRAEPQHVRRALLEALVERLFAEAKARGERLPIRISPTVSADTWEELAEKREQARALTREGLMLKAREGAYGIGRRKGGDRTDVWWKWKLDPMSVDAVVIYAERGHGRRSGVYTDYTFAVWSAGERPETRELMPFAKAYSGLTDAEIREMDAIVRRTTIETFGPVRRLNPTQVFELGFEGIAPSKRHKSGVAVRFPRMLRWRRDKPIAEADTLDALKALLAGRMRSG